MAAGSSATSKVVLVTCLLVLCHGTYGGELYGKNTEEEGCIVLHNASFLTPRSVHIPSYITPKQPMSIELTYNGRDENTHKDVVELSNTEATHRAWENGRYTAARHLFPINMTKGWNTLTFTAAEENITLTYLTWEDKEVHEQRHLNFTIKTIYLKGNFSLCSGASPEWLVSDNSEVAVPLDYQSEARQLLEVTGDGNAATFLKLSEGEKYVPANTTLALSTTQQASGYTVEVREGDKYLGHYSSSEPAVVMGSRQGNSHLRLKRETSSPPPTTEFTECIVLASGEEKEIPFISSILSYITSDNLLLIVLTFKGHDKDVYRDEVTVSNNATEVNEVRSKTLRSKRSSKPHIFPNPVSEGWVTLRIDVEEKDVTLSWVRGKDEVILFRHSTYYTMDKLLLDGKFSVCSGESPEWQLDEGKEVEVPLDLLDHMQQLEVTGQGNATAFLKLSYGQINLPANTILTVNTTRKGSDYIAEVSFKVSNEERFHIEQPARAQPVLVFGGLRGNTRLRLNRSASSTSLPPPSSSPSPALPSPSLLDMINLILIIVFGGECST